MFYSCKSQFREKNPVFPIEKFSILAQARNTPYYPFFALSTLKWSLTGQTTLFTLVHTCINKHWKELKKDRYNYWVWRLINWLVFELAPSYFKFLTQRWRKELKTKRNFEHLALKVVEVAYERWSLTRGSKYSGLTWKRLVFWKTGRLRELVAYESWSQPGVRLYTQQSPNHLKNSPRHTNGAQNERRDSWLLETWTRYICVKP